MTPTQAAYRKGWKDATETFCNSLHRVSTNPAILANPTGREIARMLSEISTDVQKHLEQMADQICQIQTANPNYRLSSTQQ